MTTKPKKVPIECPWCDRTSDYQLGTIAERCPGCGGKMVEVLDWKDPTCRCCTCQGIHCLIYHPGHDHRVKERPWGHGV